MAIIETIIPIFLIIIFGYILQQRGMLKAEFIQEANRFVFLFSLPVLIFTGIMKSDIKDVGLTNILLVIIPTLIILCVAFLLALAMGLRRGTLGSFVQTTFHGNITYIGLAVLYYMLGEEGLKKGSILIGFLILVNNTLAIAILSWTSQRHTNILKSLTSIAKTPLIVATFVGMLLLYLDIPVSKLLMKSMGILANIALPMALIIIGASMSVSTIKSSFRLSGIVAIMKLMVLPSLSFLFCYLYAIPLRDALPGIILLATPTATTSFILANQIGGDTELASGVITLSTLLSPFAFIFWAYIVG
ncbi:MAG: auxin efflux carrier [Deltaproteobacteria bacterium]|nr:auxin efflux carrier [Deltaproteobacteria bacterium]